MPKKNKVAPQLKLTSPSIDRHTSPESDIDMEKPLWKLAGWRVTWVIFSKMESEWEISTFPISLHSDESNTW